MKTKKPQKSKVSTRLLLRGALLIGIGTVLAAVAAIWWFNQQTLEIRTSGRIKTAKLMAEGVAIAIEEDVIARNYAQLEARLKQTMSDRQVLSILVADEEGLVLSHIKRESNAHEPKLIYASPPISLPTQSNLVVTNNDVVSQWVRLDAGVPIGWLQIQIESTEIDHALITLRKRVSAWLLFACVLLLIALAAVLSRARVLIRMEEATMNERNSALEQAAYSDSLTGLPNRHLLLDRIEQAIAFSKRNHHRFAVCFMDLDEFKNINDSYGHEAGDQVLKEVARRLEMCVRNNDTIARLGGDEFVFLLTDTSSTTDYEEVLARVLAAICQPIRLATKVTVKISCSIGMTIYPNDNSTPSILLEHADQAMYQAKRLGKCRWSAHHLTE